MITAYIALGSNLKNPERQLQQAVCAIDAWNNTTITGISSVYQSSAVGPGKQADYLNAVLALMTDVSPSALLEQLQQQENHQGRIRTARWGARTLDLDILLYGDHVVSTDTLEIPHPAMKERHFVLYPLAQVAGTGMMLPDGTDLGSLLKNCPREGLELTGVVLPNPRESNNQTKEPGPDAG